jgi:hypothetical protein
MEETNYVRSTVGVVEMGNDGSETPMSTINAEKEVKGSAVVATDSDAANVTAGYTSKKTYLQKLSLWNPTPGDAMFTRAARSLRYLGWPVIFFAGFSYGTYLVSSIRLLVASCPALQ